MAEARLAEYDAAYPGRFAHEARQIRDALAGVVVEIEHVGSTAVTGLAGKSTIDIAVGARSLPLDDDAVAAMVALGYHDAGHNGLPQRLFRKGSEVPWEYLVHVVEHGSLLWCDFLAFRDHLRAHPEDARAYTELKRALLEERGDWYRGADKARFIARVAGTFSVQSSSAEETEAVAAELARTLRPGDVVTVSGDLGSGKTTFVRGACRALGISSPVTSPTYTIGHRYPGDPDVAHLDLYRLAALASEDWGDLEPYFDGTIAFVEWPEAAAGWLPPVRAAVTISHVDEDHRLIRVDARL